MNKKEQNSNDNLKNKGEKASSTVTVTFLFSTLLVWTLCLGGAFVYFLDKSDSKNYTGMSILNEKINNLEIEVKNKPGIVTMNLAKVSREWAGHDNALVFKAVDTSIKYYTDRGYLVIDANNAIGDTSQFDANVPTPSKMADLMKKAESSKQ